jgi:hypothetical protein
VPRGRPCSARSAPGAGEGLAAPTLRPALGGLALRGSGFALVVLVFELGLGSPGRRLHLARERQLALALGHVALRLRPAGQRLGQGALALELLQALQHHIELGLREDELLLGVAEAVQLVRELLLGVAQPLQLGFTLPEQGFTLLEQGSKALVLGEGLGQSGHAPI